MRFSTGWLSVIFCALLLAPGLAAAQTAPPSGDGSSGDKQEKPSSRRDMPKDMPDVISLDSMTIIGRIQKPEVFYVLGRTDFSYKGLRLKRSFVDRIGKSVRSNPF
jgi:hypothetical protein